MASNPFNNAEQFVLKNWAQATDLEDSIESVRDKYWTLCERAASDFCDANRQFDCHEIKVNHIASGNTGYLWVSKSSWPKSSKWPTGFYIDNLRLDYAVHSDSTPPTSYLFICSVDGLTVNLASAKRIIRGEAAVLLPTSRWSVEDKSYSEGDDEIPFGLPFCTRAELFDLLADEAGDRFTLRLTRELEMLALLEPVLDRVFSTPAK